MRMTRSASRLATLNAIGVFAVLWIAMGVGPMLDYVLGRGLWGRGDDDARVAMDVSYAF